MRLIYLSSARQDLADILGYITRESGSLAVGRPFVGKLTRQCEKLATLPATLGRARPELRPDIRSIPLQTYVIFFRYAGDAVEIVNALEGHRDIDGYYET